MILISIRDAFLERKARRQASVKAFEEDCRAAGLKRQKAAESRKQSCAKGRQGSVDGNADCVAGCVADV